MAAPSTIAAPGERVGAVDGSSLAVSLRGVTKTYGPKVVLDHIDLDVRRGEFVALLGPSGTGKTTLLRILTGLVREDGGQVLVPEVRTTVYQEPRLVQSLRVLPNVTLGQRNRDAVRRAGQARAWSASPTSSSARHRPAVLLVTHEVDEAIALADRILVLRDGRFSVDIGIDAPRPRDRTDPGFVGHRRLLLRELGVDLHDAPTRTGDR